MNSRTYIIQDELEKHNYIEMQTDQRHRSLNVNIMCNGYYSTLMLDMAEIKRAIAEMSA